MSDFEEIYNLYLKEVYYFLYKLSGDAHIAEELTQDTFTIAYENLERFRGDCKLSVWLCQIAKHNYFSYVKKQKQMIYVDNEAIQIQMVDKSNTEEQVIESLTRLQLHEILHYLQEPYKEIFMLRVFGELTYKEIGKIFGKSDSWARVTYYRAKGMIRERIKEEAL